MVSVEEERKERQQRRRNEDLTVVQRSSVPKWLEAVQLWLKAVAERLVWQSKTMRAGMLIQ